MKKTKTIYWLTTGIVSVMMLFSAYMYITNPDMKKGFEHVGFPDYFRIELAIAKFLGAIVLLAPVASRVKEWAYAGFGINFISAFIAHMAVGDAFSNSVSPLVFLALLIVSNISYHRLRTEPKQITVPVQEEGFEHLVARR